MVFHQTEKKGGGEVSPEPEALEVRASGAAAGVPPGEGQWYLVSLVNLVRASGVPPTVTLD